MATANLKKSIKAPTRDPEFSVILELQEITSKGQLISKCLFGAIVSTKKPTKIL